MNTLKKLWRFIRLMDFSFEDKYKGGFIKKEEWHEIDGYKLSRVIEHGKTQA